MCDLSKKPFIPPAPTRTQRYKLWELDHSFHCAILGTCVTMTELRKALRQSGLLLDPNASDYDAHRTVVARAGEACRSSQLLNKLLDRKYQRIIKQFSQLNTDCELSTAWQQANQSGDIAGPFWALATHPATSHRLMHQAYGELHMLSHQVGASNHADLRRLHALESEVAELREAQALKERQHQNQLARQSTLIRQLEQQLLDQLSRHSRAASSREAELEEQLAGMRRRLSVEARLLERTRRRLNAARQRADTLDKTLSEQESLAKTALADQQLAEQLLDQLLAGQPQPEDARTLCGRQVVYVGGRTSLSPHFRSLVERYQGRFEHHDGGIEESRANLHCLLSKADMVFCPIDCISHDACLRVKRFCKQHAKQFVPLRSSGLTSFARELTQLAQASSNTRPVEANTTNV